MFNANVLLLEREREREWIIKECHTLSRVMSQTYFVILTVDAYELSGIMRIVHTFNSYVYEFLSLKLTVARWMEIPVRNTRVKQLDDNKTYWDISIGSNFEIKLYPDNLKSSNKNTINKWITISEETWQMLTLLFECDACNV